MCHSTISPAAFDVHCQTLKALHTGFKTPAFKLWNTPVVTIIPARTPDPSTLPMPPASWLPVDKWQALDAVIAQREAAVSACRDAIRVRRFYTWTNDDYYSEDDERKSREIDALALAPAPAPVMAWPMFPFRGYGYLQDQAESTEWADAETESDDESDDEPPAPSIFADAHPLPLQPVSLDELFPVVIDNCTIAAAADFGDSFALGDVHPVAVYKFDGEKGRRLGAAQLRKEMATMRAAGDVVRTWDESAGDEVAAILYNGGVHYVSIRQSNGGKRVRAWLWCAFEHCNEWVQLDKKGWAWYLGRSEGRAELAK